MSLQAPFMPALQLNAEASKALVNDPIEKARLAAAESERQRLEEGERLKRQLEEAAAAAAIENVEGPRKAETRVAYWFGVPIELTTEDKEPARLAAVQED